MGCANQQRVDRARYNSGKRKDRADERGPFRNAICARHGIEVRHHGNADADWNQCECNLPRYRFPVDYQIQERNARRKERPDHLVELYARVRQGYVLQDHIEDHAESQG